MNQETPAGGASGRDAWREGRAALSIAAIAAWLTVGCAAPGRLSGVAAPVAPVAIDAAAGEGTGASDRPQARAPARDTSISLIPGTGDASKRFLGRLRRGSTADTLNVILFGDNRPGWRAARLQAEYAAMRRATSLHPLDVVRGLLAIPVALVHGLFPDLALLRDVPDKLRNMPTWGREKQVLRAMLTKIDSLHARGQEISVVVNTGDLVHDGRVPRQWERFLELVKPLTERVPYFPVPGNHERTDTPLGVENWHSATGLPVVGDRLYYCFDSADGWVRFIALDTNPMVDASSHWSRAAQVSYSDEQFKWLVDRVREHQGPVLVMMHHPPFSVGFHRDEWQRDPVLRERRARMLRALHDSRIAVLATGHEHAYERTLLTWPDAMVIAIMTGGGGAPLHIIPSAAASSALFSQYRVAGAEIKPENVVTARAFNFVLMRLWFGGGEFHAYAVDHKARTKPIDQMQIDLRRYGVPDSASARRPVAPRPAGPTPKRSSGSQ